MLTENTMNGGGGHSHEAVAKMTLDQVWHHLCNMDLLKKPVGGRVQKMQSLATTSVLTPDSDGFIRGRDKHGKPIKGRICGKSLCQQLKEKEQLKTKKKRRRRK